MRQAEPALHPEAEIAALREQIERTGEHMARTLMRATRLAQVISVLGSESDLKTIVERAAIEVGELFFADMAVLILNSDAGLSIAGHWGVAAGDLPEGPFALPDVENVTRLRSVRVGPVADLPIPEWLVRYSPRHVAWVRLLVGERSLGVMLLARRGDEPFEASDATELRAIAYRIALAIENGQLHKRMTDQLRAAAPATAADGGVRGHAGPARCRAALGRDARLRGRRQLRGGLDPARQLA